jgi:YjbE family integral membrane protein
LESLLIDVAALIQVILIDLALSADNAVAVGLVASALPVEQRRQAVLWGVLLALVLRIAFGLITVQLLQIRGLLLLGGLMLLWIAWRMWNDLRPRRAPIADQAAPAQRPGPVTFTRALISIVIADVALSLDNVLAVAGVSRHTPAIMAFGLILSVVLMGVAASFIARIVDTYRWIAYAGIAVIVVAGVVMAWDDLHYFFRDRLPPPPAWLGGRDEARLDFAFG